MDTLQDRFEANRDDIEDWFNAEGAELGELGRSMMSMLRYSDYMSEELYNCLLLEIFLIFGELQSNYNLVKTERCKECGRGIEYYSLEEL